MEKHHHTPASHLPSIQVIYTETWELYKEKFQTLVGISIFPFAFGWLQYYLSLTSFGKSNTFESGLVLFLMTIVSIAISVISQAASLYALTGKDSIVQAYQKGVHIALPIFWVNILCILRIFVGLLLLIIPGVYMIVQYLFAEFVFIIEGKKGMGALTGSAEHVKGKWWQIFRLYLVGLLAYYGVYIALSLLPEFFPQSRAILTQVFSLLTGPIILTGIYILYTHAKSAKHA